MGLISDLRGSVALVTGGASGIGFAIARALHREGVRIALADIAADWLDQAVAELGGETLGLQLDVTDRAAWPLARQQVEERLGPTDILVNNAGIGPDLAPLAKTDPKVFDRLVAIKLTGTFNGIHTIVPGMIARGRGHVINTASMAGLCAMPALGAYTAAKFAVVGLSEVLRAELEPAGIGVSVLCPGQVATRLIETTRRAGFGHHGDGPTLLEGLDPAVVGELVVAGIRENRLHIITHGHHERPVKARMEAILGAFARAREGANGPSEESSP